MKRPNKSAKAAWVDAFPAQAAALHPERTAAGGVKVRSESKAWQDKVYAPIRELFLRVNPYCWRCSDGEHKHVWAKDVHHRHGKEGLLYFWVPGFVPVCRKCHDWIHSHPDAARAEGWLAPVGQWREHE